MRRSEINAHIESAKAFFAQHQFQLPPFAFWTPEQWKTQGQEADEIRQCQLGWDVTDFGGGDFSKKGLLLFTLRNGSMATQGGGGGGSEGGKRLTSKQYAEKIMVVLPGQVTPFHFHFDKTEDIINRGAGLLMLQLYNSTPDGQFAQTPVIVSCDGVRRQLPAGGWVSLSRGESITLTPGLYHQFFAEPAQGTGLIGEVSSVNDDATDNRFYQPAGRFPAIQEDVPATHLLCSEYPAAV